MDKHACNCSQEITERHICTVGPGSAISFHGLDVRSNPNPSKNYNVKQTQKTAQSIQLSEKRCTQASRSIGTERFEA